MVKALGFLVLFLGAAFVAAAASAAAFFVVPADIDADLGRFVEVCENCEDCCTTAITTSEELLVALALVLGSCSELLRGRCCKLFCSLLWLSLRIGSLLIDLMT